MAATAIALGQRLIIKLVRELSQPIGNGLEELRPRIALCQVRFSAQGWFACRSVALALVYSRGYCIADSGDACLSPIGPSSRAAGIDLALDAGHRPGKMLNRLKTAAAGINRRL